jgi:hypothetical protein
MHFAHFPTKGSTPTHSASDEGKATYVFQLYPWGQSLQHTLIPICIMSTLTVRKSIISLYWHASVHDCTMPWPWLSMWTLLPKCGDKYLTSCWLAFDYYCSEWDLWQKMDVPWRSNGPSDKRVALSRCEAHPLSLQLTHFMYCDNWLHYPANINVFTVVSH